MLISVLFVLISLFQQSNKQCGISINKKKKGKKENKTNHIMPAGCLLLQFHFDLHY